MILSAPVALTVAHDLSGFDCGTPVLDDWLRERGLRNQGAFSRTFVVCAGDRVVGYYCVSAGSVQRATVPGKIRRNAPDVIPVTILGRLAMDKGHWRRGLGSAMRSDVSRRIVAAADSIGIAAVMVEVKDQDAVDFYMRCAEFLTDPDASRTLFLPIKTIRAALP